MENPFPYWRTASSTFRLRRQKTKQNRIKPTGRITQPRAKILGSHLHTPNYIRNLCKLPKEQGGTTCRRCNVRPETNEHSSAPSQVAPSLSILHNSASIYKTLDDPGPTMPPLWILLLLFFSLSEKWINSTQHQPPHRLKESTAYGFSFTHVLCKRYPWRVPQRPSYGRLYFLSCLLDVYSSFSPSSVPSSDPRTGCCS